jgi:hypothetical protein
MRALREVRIFNFARAALDYSCVKKPGRGGVV